MKNVAYDKRGTVQNVIDQCLYLTQFVPFCHQVWPLILTDDTGWREWALKMCTQNSQNLTL